MLITITLRRTTSSGRPLLIKLVSGSATFALGPDVGIQFSSGFPFNALSITSTVISFDMAPDIEVDGEFTLNVTSTPQGGDPVLVVENLDWGSMTVSWSTHNGSAVEPIFPSQPAVLSGFNP